VDMIASCAVEQEEAGSGSADWLRGLVQVMLGATAGPVQLAVWTGGQTDGA
jgi:hypothetical protein